MMLGFEPVRPVEKTRACSISPGKGGDLELAVDSIDELGTFLEIEAMAEENERDAARDAILRLAERLGLKNPERRSYLALHAGVRRPQSRRDKAPFWRGWRTFEVTKSCVFPLNF